MPTVDVDDTIVAIASPPGGALRGIIRVSGPHMLHCLGELFFDQSNRPLKTRKIISRSAIDCDLAISPQTRLPGRLLVWPDTRSYTRQPTAEFHTIGSPPLLEMATATICASGARLAERGEFTLRAFLSGRIDLTQAEAVLAVIDSGSEVQLQNALAQLSGGLAGPLARIRQTLVGVLAEIEAGLDFVEEDIEFISANELSSRLKESGELLSKLNEQIQSRSIAGQSFRVPLIGHPNAGKSSLFNSMLGAERAIVSECAGTTRDFVSATRRWNGTEIQIVDTAGLELTSENPHLHHEIHARSQFQTRQQLLQADAVVCCIPVNSSSGELDNIGKWLDSIPAGNVIAAITKADLTTTGDALPLPREIAARLSEALAGGHVILTSSVDFTGIEQLKCAIVEMAKQSQHNSSCFVNSTATRAASSLLAAENAVRSALDAVREEIGFEIVAAEIRRSLDELGAVIGTVYTDDILDQVFSRFCIGK